MPRNGPCGTAGAGPPCWRCSMRTSGRLDEHGFHVEVFLHVLRAGLAAVAAHLVAAERHGGIHLLVAVDPHGAGADGTGHAMRLGHVAGPDAAAEAERRVVGAA